MNDHQAGNDNLARLRRSLMDLSTSLRKMQGEPLPDIPRYVSCDSLRHPDGRVVSRKKVILMSGGCSVPTCTMCPFTNENNYGLESDPHALVDQVTQVLPRLPGEPDYEVLALSVMQNPP